ncbi:MAG: hypothetical protein ABIR79_14940 [Candidatus Binatia bacterium]
MSRARGKSVNATVPELLEQAAGVGGRKEWLRRSMTWIPDEVRAFDVVIQAQRPMDDKLWR